MNEDEKKMIYEVISKGWKTLKKYADEYDGSTKESEWWHSAWDDINAIMELTDGTIFQSFAKEYCDALIGVLQIADRRRIRNASME